jgi:hypothetical protein
MPDRAEETAVPLLQTDRTLTAAQAADATRAQAAGKPLRAAVRADRTLPERTALAAVPRVAVPRVAVPQVAVPRDEAPVALVRDRNPRWVRAATMLMALAVQAAEPAAQMPGVPREQRAALEQVLALVPAKLIQITALRRSRYPTRT